MVFIFKNSDDSYYFLYKLLRNKGNVVYTDKEFKNEEVSKLIIPKVDNSGYISETNVLLSDLITKNDIKQIICESNSKMLKKICEDYKVKYNILEEDNTYNLEINKLKAIILLKFILSDNKNSIFNLKFLVLGSNLLSQQVSKILSNYTTSYDIFEAKNIEKISTSSHLEINSLKKYDIIINTTETKQIPDDLFFDVKRNLILYDLTCSYSSLDYKILEHNFIKYRYINNIALYLPEAKANLLSEMMCENGCI